MALACPKCGGAGYGYIDPEVGHRGKEPCDVCKGKLEERTAAGEFDTKVRGKTVKGKVPELGLPVAVRAAANKTVAFVDAPGRQADPAEEGLTADEAAEAGWFSPEAVEAQQEADLAALSEEGV